VDTHSYVLTLVAADQGGLDEQTVMSVADRLTGVAGLTWLAPERACDIALEGPVIGSQSTSIQDQALTALNGHAVDIALQPIAGRRKKLLIADMDSTMVVGETLDELAAYAGLKDKVAVITARAMHGELDFKSALRERVSMLAGLSESALAETYENLELMPGAASLVATMKDGGAHTALVSGGFDYFTARVADRLGFDMDSANKLDIDNGHLTGTVVDPIRDRNAKRDTLVSLCKQLRLNTEAALAVGDGANDLAMIQHAGLGVAYHAKPAFREAARFRVDHGDLTTLLFYQGYRHDEIVSSKKGAP